MTRVYVEITNLCNKSCSFCHGHKRAPRRMSADEFSHVLDELRPHTSYVYYHLMGEPLTHPDLPLFLSMAAEKGFHSVITTNGTLLARRKHELLASPIHKINLSVHSFEDGNEEECEAYLSELAEFAKAASEQGIIVVLRLWNRGYDGGRNDKVYDFFRSQIEGDWVENTRGVRIRQKLFLEWGDRFSWPDLGAPVQGDRVFCYGLGDHFGILCDGTVVPCCLDSEGTVNLGNVFTESLDSILSSPRATRIAEGFRQHVACEELCRRCGYAQRFLR